MLNQRFLQVPGTLEIKRQLWVGSGHSQTRGFKTHLAFTSATQTGRHILIGEAQLDLNYLLFRQQVERSRAATAATEIARDTHEELAKKYEEQIEQLTGEAFSISSNVVKD